MTGSGWALLGAEEEEVKEVRRVLELFYCTVGLDVHQHVKLCIS
jgi:hypothetical protein